MVLRQIPESQAQAMWYVIHAGVESGPLTIGELVEKVVSGAILAEDLVREDNGLWMKASEVQYLQFLKGGTPGQQPKIHDHLQSLTDKIEVRLGPGYAILPMIFGAFAAATFPGAFIYGAMSSKNQSGITGEMLGAVAFCFGMGAFGVWLFWTGWKQFNDHAPKLSIGPDALIDHRIDLVIPWRLIKNVRVQITTTNCKLSAATMYLSMLLKGELGEVPIDVFGLDRPYAQIVELVRQRAASA